MASGNDILYTSLPSKKTPNTNYRRGFQRSDKRFPMPMMEECQFFLKLKDDKNEKFHVSEDKDENDLVTLLVQTERLVMVRSNRSWDWRMGCIRRYGWSTTEFYFESGRKSRTGEGVLTFLTDVGKKINSRLNEMKDFCQFDLYCQRGIIPDLLLVDNPPNRTTSVKDKSEKRHVKQETGRRTSTGSLPY